jgi:hypothetical protein
MQGELTMNANNSLEADSHHHIGLKEHASYLLQLSCFWLILATYLFPMCKQKFNQVIGK